MEVGADDHWGVLFACGASGFLLSLFWVFGGCFGRWPFIVLLVVY
jgi:hypothetical protein